jgi:hypothetical protein
MSMEHGNIGFLSRTSNITNVGAKFIVAFLKENKHENKF